MEILNFIAASEFFYKWNSCYMLRHTSNTLDHVYFIHLSVEHRPTLGRYLGRHSGKIATDTWSSVGRHVLQVGRPSVATIGRLTFFILFYFILFTKNDTR